MASIEFVCVGDSGTRSILHVSSEALIREKQEEDQRDVAAEMQSRSREAAIEEHNFEQGTTNMNTQDPTGLTIEVSGPPDSGKTLVACIITKALDKAGFTNVTLSDQEGKVVVPEEPKTLLEAIAMSRPEILAQPIDVVETTMIPEEDSDVIELSDTTLRLGPEDIGALAEEGSAMAVIEEFGE